jgi:hypothetical protein
MDPVVPISFIHIGHARVSGDKNTFLKQGINILSANEQPKLAAMRQKVTLRVIPR